MPATPPKGDPAYGTAPEGSLSDERAKKAAAWVEKEVDKLCTEITSLGVKQGNHVTVTFGELFHHYQDVSDTLVGILARAKKRIARKLGSGPLAREAAMTYLDSGLSVGILAALATNMGLGWWWADSAPAIAVAVLAGTQGIRSWRDSRPDSSPPR